MSNDHSIDKDRASYTQNHKKSRLRCPECIRIKKILRHCKIYKSLAQLWWHFKQEHNEVSNLLFCTQDIKDVLNGLSKAMDWGILPSESEIPEAKTTTSSSVLIDGRPPRIDSWGRIVEIAKLLKTQSELYPNFKPKQLEAIVKVVLGPVDSRTLKKYIDCVTSFSKKDIEHGLYDVTDFCNSLRI